MQERELRDGEVVYRIGDRADMVYSVISGFVILRRPNPGGSSREQLLGPGAVFGAAEVLAGTMRGADATAHGRGTIAAHLPEEAINAILDRPEAADAMIASALAARRREEAERAALETIGRSSLKLVALGPAVIEQLGEAPLVVDEFPFVIGRRSEGRRSGVTLPVSLALLDKPPFRLSRRHFAIERDAARFVVRDCRSYHGTIVNGTALGTGADSFLAALVPGENEIVAGGAQSPFRFSCIVPPPPAA